MASFSASLLSFHESMLPVYSEYWNLICEVKNLHKTLGFVGNDVWRAKEAHREALDTYNTFAVSSRETVHDNIMNSLYEKRQHLCSHRPEDEETFQKALVSIERQIEAMSGSYRRYLDDLEEATKKLHDAQLALDVSELKFNSVLSELNSKRETLRNTSIPAGFVGLYNFDPSSLFYEC